MHYSCLLIDDEPLAQKVLMEYIARMPELQVVKQAFSAAEARKYLLDHEVDILLLDIEMPEESGITFLKSLSAKPVTIFTTAFINYSLDGFELGVMDYLVKPIRYERFQLAIKKSIDFIELLKLKSAIEAGDKKNETLLIKTGTRRKPVNRNLITHVQAMKDYAIIYCSNEKHVVRSTMKEMEELLGIADFTRIHKSFIISKHKVKFYAAGKIEFDGFEIPVGRKYKVVVEYLLK